MIDRSDAVNLARNLREYLVTPTLEGVRSLVDAVLAMDDYIRSHEASDQPDKAVQAGAKEQDNLRPGSSSDIRGTQMIELRWLNVPGVQGRGLFRMQNGDPYEMVLQYRQQMQMELVPVGAGDGHTYVPNEGQTSMVWSAWKDVPFSTGDESEGVK